MKSSHAVFGVLFIAGCMLNGCDQNKLPTEVIIPNPPPSGPAILSVNIDGLPWTAEAAGIPSGTASYSGNVLQISGVRAVVGDTAASETIDLIIDLSASRASIGPGTYKLGTMPAQEGEAEHYDGLTCVCHTSSAHSGTVTITALDVARKVVSGTFAFDGMGDNGQTHTFSEGMFDVAWN